MQQKYGGGDKKVERNIEARSDGFSFRVRMKIGSTYVNETFFTLEEARAYRDLLRAGKATDKDQEKVLKAKAEKKKAASMTIGTLLDRYLKEVSIHKKGHKDEAYSIGRLQRIKSFSSLPVYLADGDTIERLKHDIRASKPLSDTTMRKYLMLVSHMFKIAMTRRWCKDLQNPVKTVELPRPARMRSRRFDTDEFTYLCAELSKARNALVLPFFEFLVETACRRGEALRLRAMDVDMNARTAILIDTKNGEDRTIGLSSRAIQILEPLMVNKTVGKVINLRNESQRKVFPLSTDSLRSAFAAAIKRAQAAYLASCTRHGHVPNENFLRNVRLHDSRREATTRMFEKGLDLMEVATQSGHKTLSILRGYTALRAANLAKRLG
jgi:integrase